MAKLKSFKVFDLWSDTNVNLTFVDNNLIMVGENGSGKTTILRILYEALSCRWALLAREEFEKLIIDFDNGISVTIKHSDLESALNLIIKDAPYSLRRWIVFQIKRLLMKTYSSCLRGMVIKKHMLITKYVMK